MCWAGLSCACLSSLGRRESIWGVREGWLNRLRPGVTFYFCYIEARSKASFTFKGRSSTLTHLSFMMTRNLIIRSRNSSLWERGPDDEMTPRKRRKEQRILRNLPYTDYRNLGKEGSWDNWSPKAQESQSESDFWRNLTWLAVPLVSIHCCCLHHHRIALFFRMWLCIWLLNKSKTPLRTEGRLNTCVIIASREI